MVDVDLVWESLLWYDRGCVELALNIKSRASPNHPKSTTDLLFLNVDYVFHGNMMSFLSHCFPWFNMMNIWALVSIWFPDRWWPWFQGSQRPVLLWSLRTRRHSKRPSKPCLSFEELPCAWRMWDTCTCLQLHRHICIYYTYFYKYVCIYTFMYICIHMYIHIYK